MRRGQWKKRDIALGTHSLLPNFLQIYLWTKLKSFNDVLQTGIIKDFKALDMLASDSGLRWNWKTPMEGKGTELEAGPSHCHLYWSKRVLYLLDKGPQVGSLDAPANI